MVFRNKGNEFWFEKDQAKKRAAEAPTGGGTATESSGIDLEKANIDELSAYIDSQKARQYTLRESPDDAKDSGDAIEAARVVLRKKLQKIESDIKASTDPEWLTQQLAGSRAKIEAALND